MNAALIFPSGTKHKHIARYETAQNVELPFPFRAASIEPNWVNGLDRALKPLGLALFNPSFKQWYRGR